MTPTITSRKDSHLPTEESNTSTDTNTAPAKTSLPVPTPDDVDVVLYHKNCPDGMGAAWAAWKRLGDKAQYIAVNYGEPLPDVRGKNVAVVDFSYTGADLDLLLNSAKSLVILDHHKTAAELIGTHPNARIDQTHSGAILSWNYFHPGEEAPVLEEYIQDKDLWQWRLDNSHAVSAFISTVPFEMTAFDQLMQKDIHKVMDQGAAILLFQDNLIQETIKDATVQNLFGYKVAVLNDARVLRSELGDALLSHMHCDFAIVYEDNLTTGEILLSLRSTDHGPDMTEIAHQIQPVGGGGHRDAAGAKWHGSIQEFIKTFGT